MYENEKETCVCLHVCVCASGEWGEIHKEKKYSHFKGMMEWNMEVFAHLLKSHVSLCGCRLPPISAPYCMYIYSDIYMDDIKLTFTLWANKNDSKCPS